ncbi:MAG TPA: polysaccharide biosynthesis tyrosine autokinase [Acidobacteria bacterium]|nr:polysaccharide biosynthesis tyrosine autokinase [Acidobacteriota bacterium]
MKQAAPMGPAGPPAGWGMPPAQWPMQEGPWFEEETEREFSLVEYTDLLWRQRWLIAAVVLICILAGGAWAFTTTKMYRARTRIAFEQAPQIIKSQIYGGPSWWELQQYTKDQMLVLQTHRLAERVAEKLGLNANPAFGKDPAAMLLGRLKIENVKDTNILELSMTGKDPDKVAEWLNVYVQEYIAINIEDNLNRTRKVYQVISEKLNPLRQQLEQSEQKLISFKEKEESFLVGDQDKNVITEQVNTLTTEYAKAKAERIKLETKIAALQGVDVTSLSRATLPDVLQDPTIQQLKRQLDDLEVELADKLRTYKSGHPVIKELRSRISSIKLRIKQQIQTIVKGLRTDYRIRKAREASLYRALQQLRDQAINLSKQNLEYEKLQHEYEQNKTFYEQMLQRSKETDISASAALNNVRVIDPAEPPKHPYKPNPPRILSLSLILGLFLGVGLAFGLDFIDQTLRRPEEAERYLGLETLAAVPKFTDETTHVAREVYQSLRTAVMMAAREEGPQVLMVTSAAPQEGKTTTAFNLAKALAAGGSRVLVVDADLRKPRFHRILGVKNVRGLTSIVLGERGIRDVIHTVADQPNLDIITSGPLPPNPPEVFGKASFKRMLDEARSQYDWIVIDTPPVSSVTDAVICARLTDMVVLVIRYATVKRGVILNSVRQLAKTGTRLAGIVFNDVTMERGSYYYNYYYAYYHYGYGEETEGKGQKRFRRKKKKQKDAEA